MTPTRTVALVILLGALAAAPGGTQAPRFYGDDPIGREPEPQDASKVEPWKIGLLYDLGYQLVVTSRRTPSNTRAQNINTIDEVPDSSWFTNRIGSRPVSVDEVLAGTTQGPPPAAERWTVIREKTSGFAPGFTATSANGETWFLSFDPPTNPEGATGALAVANRIFWALGYNQVETFLTTVDPSHIDIDPGATARRPSGERSPLTGKDLAEVMERAHRNADGTFRAAAARLLKGKILGGFRYEGTRPDDPNDIVPHEHRRELRALRVFGAWTNLTDMKAGNTLDVLEPVNGRGIVKHYLQDVGSTFGIGANGPHDWDEGFEYFYQGDTTVRRLLTFGFDLSPWQTAAYTEYPAVGRFEGDVFDPTTWKPHTPTSAYLELRADDAFWAARRVMAFTDEMIRAVVKTAQFGDPAAERHLADVLIKRRDKIGRAYLVPINPIVDPALDAAGTLTFGNAAVQFGFASAPESYAAAWFAFDNATGATRPLGETASRDLTLKAPAGLPAATGAFIRVDLHAASADQPAWARPVRAFFKKVPAGWALVGFERMPEPDRVSP
jgi:hypothetical protein